MKSLLPGKCPTCSLIHFVEPWLIFFFVMVGHLTRLMPLPHLTIPSLRASPLTRHLHLHLCFYICDVDADAGPWPSHPGITHIWMNFFAGGVELPAFRQVIQGACYQLKDQKLCWWSSWIRRIIGWGLTVTPIVTNNPTEFEKQPVDVWGAW